MSPAPGEEQPPGLLTRAVLVNTKLTTRQQCALVAKAANSVLGCMRRSTPQVERVFPLCSHC